MVKLFDWDSITYYGQLLYVPGNTVLFRQGDIGTGFYYLKDGEIKISVVSYNGDERIIDYSSSGELVGEHGINESPYFTTAETIKDSTLYYFSPKNFHDLCVNLPEAAEELNTSITTKIRMMVNIKSFLNAPIEVQLANLFYRFYEKTKNNTIYLSQTTISHFLGTSRVTVWKILNKWKKENIIKIEDRIIYINDVQKLTQKLNHLFPQP